MSDSNSSKRESKQPATLASVVRAAREAAGLSIRQLAPLVRAHYSVLARIEAGDVTRPSPEMVQNIAQALELDASELLAFIGVKATLPEPKVYFRKAYGMSEREAEEAEAVIAELRAKRGQPPESG
jgi:transcriptional regulator with XRE-family HTH domain